MADLHASDAAPDPIDVSRLARFADVLLALGESYRTLATHLQKQGVSEIEGTGMKTAERAAGYLAGFTASVHKGYQKARLDGSLRDPAPDKAVAKIASAEALARNLAEGGRKKKRP